MKRRVTFSLLTLFILILLGCDAGLEIVDLEIETYPNRIVYVAGVDTALDLSGGKVKYILLDKRADGSVVPMTAESIRITHNIDFSTPGIYVVTLAQHKGMCRFPVQVVDQGFMQEYAGVPD